MISGFFGIALAVFSLIHYFMIKNIICELANGVKTSIEGAIIKKEMKVGPNEYKLDYSKESLEKLAQYIEDKEKGVTTDNSISAYNLSRDAKASFLITLADKSDYSVGIRNYINMEVGDKVRIEFTPLSRTFLNATKL